MDKSFIVGFEKTAAAFKSFSKIKMRMPKIKAKPMPMKKRTLKDLGGMFGPGAGL